VASTFTTGIAGYPNPSFSGWLPWSYTAPSAGTYSLLFNVTYSTTAGGGDKYDPYGLFSATSVSAVPEPSTWVAGGLSAFFTLFAFARSRRQNAASVRA
jgi:hypothetical protein